MAKAARAAAAPAAAPAEPASAAPAPPPALSVPAPVVPAPAEPAQPDLFDMAFAEAAAAEAEPAPKAQVVPTRKPPEPKLPPEPLAAELAAGLEPPAPAAEPAPPEPQPQPPATQPAPVQPQPQAYQPPQPQPQPQPQPYQEPPLFNTGELEQLQTFYSEWPDVARATETMIRGLVSQTVRRMYADMASSLAPYLQTIDTLADRSQLSELQTQVSDYDTVAGQLTTWAQNQPAYLRSAYERVIKSGTAAEVVDMINRYKQDMQSTMPAHGGQPAPAAPAAAAPAQSPAPAPVNPALAAAAARLAPVATKRTNVVAPPTDFDSAFAEYAKAS